MQKINPFLWFDSQAEEAAKFYTSVFKSSKIGKITHYPEEAAKKIGRELNVNCETQTEIDYFWGKLSAGGGQPGPCGWLKDKFGLSWQVSPPVLGEMLADKDKAKAERVMSAMMEMDKIDIAKLKEAADNL